MYGKGLLNGVVKSTAREGVVNGQVMAEGANEAQRAGNGA